MYCLWNRFSIHAFRHSFCLYRSFYLVKWRLKTLSVFHHRFIRSKNALFFHIIYIITIPLSSAWHKRLDQFWVWWRPGFPKTKCVVIGLLSQCVVIGKQLRLRFSIALTIVTSSEILPYQCRPREYWGSRRTFASTDIAKHNKVVMLLLFFSSLFW